MEALQAVARLGPFFTVASPGAEEADVAWQPFTTLATAEGGRLLRRQVDVLAAQLNTQLHRPVASLLHLGAAANLTSPLLAVAATYGFVPDLRPEQLRLGYCARGRLRLALTQLPPVRDQALLPALAADLIAVALERLLGTFTAALTAAVPLPEPTVTGNALSALAAAARLIEPAPAGYRARTLVDLVARGHAPLQDAGVLNWRSADTAGYFRRRNCCLFYQVPGAGTCGDCVLDPR
jgi:hypothetical protein